MLLGPCIAGVLLTGLLSGKEGVRTLFAGLLRWRAGVRWYALALLPAPILAAAVLFALSLTSPVTTSRTAGALSAGLMAGLMTVLEELGWTGFAVPRLRQQYGIVGTGLVVGVLWGVWHLLQILWVGGIYAGTASPALFLALYFLASVTQLTAYRILLVWLYDRTDSLLITTLMHASLSASTVIGFRPLETGAAFLTYLWVFSAALWALVAVVASANGGKIRGRSR